MKGGREGVLESLTSSLSFWVSEFLDVFAVEE